MLLRFLFILLFLSLLSSTNGSNKENQFPFNNYIKRSPLDFNYNVFSVNYERRMGGSFGILLTEGIYFSCNNIFKSPLDFARYGFNPGIDGHTVGTLTELQFRYYFHTKQLNEIKQRGYFVAPYGFYRYYKINNYYFYENQKSKKTTQPDFNLSTYGGGAVIGYNLVVNRISVELYTGVGIKLYNTDMTEEVLCHFNQDITTLAYTGIVPKFGFNFGFGF